MRMHHRRFLRVAILALISGCCLAGAVYAVGVGTLVDAMVHLHLRAAALASVLILLNTALVFFRFRSVLKAFGYRPHWRDAAIAFTAGQVSNQVLFNIVGQSLTRAAALRAVDIPLGVSVVATYWERLMAAGFLFVFSLIGALVLFLDVGIDLESGGTYLLSLTAGVVIASTVVLAFFLRNAAFRRRLQTLLPRILRFWPAALLTVAAQACMLSAYVVLVVDLDLLQVSAAVLAALTIVMFSASLPISFSGWGIRELSAAQALAVVGIGSSIAVAGAVAIGLLSLIVTIGGGALAVYLCVRARALRTAPARLEAAPSVAIDHDRWLGVAAAGAAVLSAVLLFFQIRVRAGAGAITVNAADILALTGLGMILLLGWWRRTFLPLPGWLTGSMAAISLLMLFSLGVGYVNFGSNDWALVNRGFGWLVIMGYVSLGAVIALIPQRGMAQQILVIFILAGLAIAAEQLLLLIYSLFLGSIPANAFTVPLRGYAANANAFAFQMVMTAACVVTASRVRSVGLRPRLGNAALVIIFAAIFYSHSRAGLAMMALLLIVSVVFPPPEGRRQAVTSVALILLVFAFVQFLPLLLSAVSSLGIKPYLLPGFSHASSDSERWGTIAEGWRLWLAHPLLGNGLGAYVQSRLASGRAFLVIHSIPVWLMAETGLLGLAVVSAVVVVVFKNVFAMIKRPDTASWGVGLIIILACLGSAGLVHDFFYQRPFWFLFGLFVAAAVRRRAASGTSANAAAMSIPVAGSRPAVRRAASRPA